MEGGFEGKKDKEGVVYKQRGIDDKIQVQSKALKTTLPLAVKLLINGYELDLLVLDLKREGKAVSSIYEIRARFSGTSARPRIGVISKGKQKKRKKYQVEESIKRDTHSVPRLGVCS